MSTRFAFVHNIPSPYRIHLFNVLGKQLRERGWELEVHFMARNHGDRPQQWDQDLSKAQFHHKFWKDLGPTLRAKEWHLNPGLLASLLKTPPDTLMVGGPWDSLTGLGASLGMLVRSSRRSIAWIETNTHSPGMIAGVVGAAKRYLLEQFDVIAVPGQQGKLWLEMLGVSRSRDVVLLPNLVDEGRFSGTTAEDGVAWRARHDIPRDVRLALWPARMIPAKGIIEFLSVLEARNLEDWVLVIQGDGPLKADIERVIAARSLRQVRLLPYVEYEQMPAAYAAADLLVLPSLHDPNPLSVVEALHAGRPLMLSRYTGNASEAVVANKNGWLVDPRDPVAMRRCIEEVFSTPRDRLNELGQASRAIAEELWSSDSCVTRFLETALGLPSVNDR